MGIEVRQGADRCHVLAAEWPEGAIPIDLTEPEAAAQEIVAAAGANPVDAVIGSDERTVLIAALAARALGLRHNSVDAARAAHDKHRMRQALAASSVPSPAFRLLAADDDPARLALEVRLPCVVKPLLLSGSRGVIRADDPQGFVRAVERLRALLGRPDLRKRRREPGAKSILVEDYVPGFEVAVEGLMQRGVLSVLALFDKPDPLEGPFFEETLYITPSRIEAGTQRAIAECTRRAAAALGLTEGPVHAELRLGPSGPVVIEVAARTIGGLCSRTLRFGAGLSLEELVLRGALGMDTESLEREAGASGVLMIPIPRAGVLRGVRGLDHARSVPSIAGIEITARVGQLLEPLPEGTSYLGFVFARAEAPAEVERALRAAQAALRFDIARDLQL